jgi:hypothetical protein
MVVQSLLLEVRGNAKDIAVFAELLFTVTDDHCSSRRRRFNTFAARQAYPNVGVGMGGQRASDPHSAFEIDFAGRIGLVRQAPRSKASLSQHGR